jgi:hypothetical protein
MFVEGDDLTATGMFLITSKLLIPALAETVYREILRSRPQIFFVSISLVRGLLRHAEAADITA